MAVDPWLPTRLRRDAELIKAEAALEKAIKLAITRWLAEVRRLVLDDGQALTAAGHALVDHAAAHPNGEALEPAAITAAGGLPNLEGFGGADPIWLKALRDLIFPDILDLFGERFLAIARVATISMQPYRDAYINQVFSRLRLFPAQEFENIRFEIAEGISEGEGIDLIRDRIAAQLDFDSTRGARGEQAASRAVQGRIDEVEKLLDADAAATDPDDPARLSTSERKALRRERGELYREKRRLDQRWEFKARRIARTELIGAFNGGDYAGALAAEEIEGRTLYKQWLATEDERTRPTHKIADGQIRNLRDPFIVGGWPLEHPGDPVGPGHEVINCRCTALFHDAEDLAALDIDPDNLPDPEGEPLVSPEQLAQNAARNAARIEAMADLNAAADTGGTMGELPDGWRGVLAPLDTRSGDGRIIGTPPTLRVREAPRALLRQPSLEMGHDGAVLVGRIDRVWIDGGMLMGEGPFNLSTPEGEAAARELGDGFSNGVSVDLDDYVMEERWHYADGTPIPDEVLEVADLEELWEEGAQPLALMSDWRLMTATLVTQPAFDQARLEPVYGYVPDDEADLPVPTGPRESTDEAGAPGLSSAAALVASLSGDVGLPVAPADTPWDAEAARARIFERFTDPETGEVDTGAVAAAFLWVDHNAEDLTAPEVYTLGFADWITDADGEDGALMTVPAAVEVLGAYVAGGPDSMYDDPEGLALMVCALYDSVREVVTDFPACPVAADDGADEGDDGMGDEDMAAAAAPRGGPRPSSRTRAGRARLAAARRARNRTAGRAPVAAAAGAGAGRMTIVAAAAPTYAAADFADPELTGPTPLTITDDGRVFGHLALFGTCHTSFPDACVTPPRSTTGYAWFHLGEVQTSDAGLLPVGKITLGTGHATARAGARPAADHYDNTGTCAALVRAGEDAHGVWVAGRLAANLSAERIAELRRSPLSGDWRRVNGNLELVAALAVNVPGFPVPRALAASAGEALSLVAAGVVPRPRPATPKRKGKAAHIELDPEEFTRRAIAAQRKFARRERAAEALAVRIGADHTTRAAALAARIGVGV